MHTVQGYISDKTESVLIHLFIKQGCPVNNSDFQSLDAEVAMGFGIQGVMPSQWNVPEAPDKFLTLGKWMWGATFLGKTIAISSAHLLGKAMLFLALSASLDLLEEALLVMFSEFYW